MLEEATRCTWGDVLGTFIWEDGWFLACEGVKHGGCAHMKRCKNLIFWKLATYYLYTGIKCHNFHRMRHRTWSTQVLRPRSFK